jgi:hypothetical protein
MAEAAPTISVCRMPHLHAPEARVDQTPASPAEKNRVSPLLAAIAAQVFLLFAALAPEPAESAGPPDRTAQIRAAVCKLITDLGDDDFETRERAEMELTGLMDSEQALRTAAPFRFTVKDPEQRHRLKRAVGKAYPPHAKNLVAPYPVPRPSSLLYPDDPWLCRLPKDYAAPECLPNLQGLTLPEMVRIYLAKAGARGVFHRGEWENFREATRLHFSEWRDGAAERYLCGEPEFGRRMKATIDEIKALIPGMVDGDEKWRKDVGNMKSLRPVPPKANLWPGADPRDAFAAADRRYTEQGRFALAQDRQRAKKPANAPRRR